MEQKLVDFIASAFKPPFRTTHWIVLIFVVLSVLYYPLSAFNRGQLPDTDDYIRFIQVFNWMDGQSWFDLRLSHLYPQHIIAMHWGRLPDLAIGGILCCLQTVSNVLHLGFSRHVMAFATAFVIPLFLLISLLFLLRGIARPVIGRTYAGLACFFVIFSSQLIYQFTPMRVDHHAYIILSAAAAFWALQNIYFGIRPLRMAVIAALAIALAMWNGAEILPMFILFGVSLTAILIAAPRRDFLTGSVFGISLLAFNALLLPVVKAPADYLLTEYDTFSIFYVYIALAAATFFILLNLFAILIKEKIARAAFALFCAVSTVAVFLHFFPDFILGPYAKANPLLNIIFFPFISEAKPLQFMQNGILQAVEHTYIPMFIFGLGVYLFTYKKISRRRAGLWLIYALFCMAFHSLASFWQMRVHSYSQLFAIIPTTAIMLYYMHRLKLLNSTTLRRGLQAALVLTLTLFPPLVWPEFFIHIQNFWQIFIAVLPVAAILLYGVPRLKTLNPVFLRYAAQSITIIFFMVVPSVLLPNLLYNVTLSGSDAANINSCKPLTLSTFLNRLPPATIMASMNYTPELMFFTPHNFIAAPYHRDDRGLADMISFYRSAGDDLASRRIAKKLDLDYVLVCKKLYYLDALSDPPTEGQPDPILAARLAAEKPPGWLSPVPDFSASEFAFFKVDKTKLVVP